MERKKRNHFGAAKRYQEKINQRKVIGEKTEAEFLSYGIGRGNKEKKERTLTESMALWSQNKKKENRELKQTVKDNQKLSRFKKKQKENILAFDFNWKDKI